jgi:hypothetical protein
VTASLARHNFSLPVDPQRLQWSPWLACDARTLLPIPSQPGIFALATRAEERPAESQAGEPKERQAQDFNSPAMPSSNKTVSAAEARSLAVFNFTASDDMAFTLDRFFAPGTPLRAGCLFVRYVVVEDPTERRAVCATLNRWLGSSADRGSLPSPALNRPAGTAWQDPALMLFVPPQSTVG